MTTPAGEEVENLRVQVMFARLEAKLDVALTQHSAQLDEHTRRLDEHDRRTERTDERLRAVELQPTVSPKAMWAAVGTVAAIAAAAAPFLDRLYS